MFKPPRSALVAPVLLSASPFAILMVVGTAHRVTGDDPFLPAALGVTLGTAFALWITPALTAPIIRYLDRKVAKPLPPDRRKK